MSSDESAEPINDFQAIGPEVFLATVAGTKFVYNVAKDTYTALKPEKPLSHTVETSETSEGKHYIETTLHNFGRHAVYIERIYVHDPEHMDFSAMENSRDSFGWSGNDDGTKELKLPIKIPSSNNLKLAFLIDMVDQSYATVGVVYRVAGLKKKPPLYKIDCAIRADTERA